MPLRSSTYYLIGGVGFMALAAWWWGLAYVAAGFFWPLAFMLLPLGGVAVYQAIGYFERFTVERRYPEDEESGYDDG